MKDPTKRTLSRSAARSAVDGTAVFASFQGFPRPMWWFAALNSTPCLSRTRPVGAADSCFQRGDVRAEPPLIASTHSRMVSTLSAKKVLWGTCLQGSGKGRGRRHLVGVGAAVLVLVLERPMITERHLACQSPQGSPSLFCLVHEVVRLGRTNAATFAQQPLLLCFSSHPVTWCFVLNALDLG